MNLGTFIVLLIVVTIVAAIVISMVREGRNGGGCTGNCASCGCGCHKKKQS